MKLKRMTALLMCAICIFSFLTFPCAVADGFEQKEEPTRIIYTSTATCYYTAAGGQRISVVVKYTKRDEPSNASGYYATGVQSITARNVSGWTYVASNAVINSVSYSDNHQQVTVNFTYNASIGSGVSAYTGTVTFRI